MTYKTHMNFGIFFAILLTLQLNLFHGKISLIEIVIAAIAALIPDMDHRKSVISRYTMPVLLLFILIFVMIKYKTYFILSIVVWLYLAITMSHRTFTHSIYGLGLFIIPFIHTPVYFFVMIGYVSHLISDALTRSGVPLFLIKDEKGRYKKNHLGGFIVTGGNMEYFIYLFLLLYNAYMILIRYNYLVKIF